MISPATKDELRRTADRLEKEANGILITAAHWEERKNEAHVLLRVAADYRSLSGVES